MNFRPYKLVVWLALSFVAPSWAEDRDVEAGQDVRERAAAAAKQAAAQAVISERAKTNAQKSREASGVQTFKFDPKTYKSPVYEDRKKLKELADGAKKSGLKEFDRIATGKGGRSVPGITPGASTPGDEAAAAVSALKPLEGRVVVALSSSMPEGMLRDYMAQLDGNREGVAVFRGFVGGATKVTPTVQLIEKARRRNAERREDGYRTVETVVDPLVFRQLGIDRVPAVAYLPGVQDLRHCDQEQLEKVIVVYGAGSIATALKTIRRRGGEVPDSILAKFQPKGWEQ